MLWCLYWASVWIPPILGVLKEHLKEPKKDRIKNNTNIKKISCCPFKTLSTDLLKSNRIWVQDSGSCMKCHVPKLCEAGLIIQTSPLTWGTVNLNWRAVQNSSSLWPCGSQQHCPGLPHYKAGNSQEPKVFLCVDLKWNDWDVDVSGLGEFSGEWSHFSEEGAMWFWED